MMFVESSREGLDSVKRAGSILDSGISIGCQVPPVEGSNIASPG